MELSKFEKYVSEDFKAYLTEEYWNAFEKKRAYYFIADQKLKKEKTFFKSLHKGL